MSRARAARAVPVDRSSEASSWVGRSTERSWWPVPVLGVPEYSFSYSIFFRKFNDFCGRVQKNYKKGGCDVWMDVRFELDWTSVSNSIGRPFRSRLDVRFELDLTSVSNSI